MNNKRNMMEHRSKKRKKLFGNIPTIFLICLIGSIIILLISVLIICLLKFPTPSYQLFE